MNDHFLRIGTDFFRLLPGNSVSLELYTQLNPLQPNSLLPSFFQFSASHCQAAIIFMMPVSHNNKGHPQIPNLFLNCTPCFFNNVLDSNSKCPIVECLPRQSHLAFEILVWSLSHTLKAYHWSGQFIRIQNNQQKERPQWNSTMH